MRKSATVATGEVGELWTRSAQNMLGYWNRPEETGATITRDGWLKTGDAGYVDEDGFVFLTDRVKDMIVSGGENIYPAEIENVLAGSPGDRRGRRHRRAGREVGRDGEGGRGAEVRSSTRPPPTSSPTASSISPATSARRRSISSSALPRNPSGKVLKKDLRAPYWAGKARRIN